MMLTSLSAQANLSEEDQAIYQNNRSETFNDEEYDLNDQGYIKDMEESEVQNQPNGVAPVKGRAQDCKQVGNTEECKDIQITN
jgi:hypothetical protein